MGLSLNLIDNDNLDDFDFDSEAVSSSSAAGVFPSAFFLYYGKKLRPNNFP